MVKHHDRIKRASRIVERFYIHEIRNRTPVAKVITIKGKRINHRIKRIIPKRTARSSVIRPAIMTIDLTINPTIRMREFMTKTEKSSSKPRFVRTSPIRCHFEKSVVTRIRIEKK